MKEEIEHTYIFLHRLFCIVLSIAPPLKGRGL